MISDSTVRCVADVHATLGEGPAWVAREEALYWAEISCASGGPSLDRLHLTSASIGLSQKERDMQPNAGGLFLVSPGVLGIADRPFAG